jgi:hypothetical protein
MYMIPSSNKRYYAALVSCRYALALCRLREECLSDGKACPVEALSGSAKFSSDSSPCKISSDDNASEFNESFLPFLTPLVFLRLFQ